MLVASLKNVSQLVAAMRLGVWGATIPVTLAEELLQSDGTAAVLERCARAASEAKGR